MVTKPAVILTVCYGIFIIMQSLPRAMALQKTSKFDEFLVEDRRTHKRQNYMLQSPRSNEILGNKEIGVPYDLEHFEPEANPEQLSDLIMDYANMFKNDVILLDNSVETRTRKSGNIKYNQALPDSLCSCNTSKELENTGEGAFPRMVETRKCSKIQRTCRPPYVCKESLYNLIIIRRKEESYKRSGPDSDEKIPDELYKWTAEKWPISVGCMCMRDYEIKN